MNSNLKINCFAVIDTETNWDNDVMSIGIPYNHIKPHFLRY